MNDAEYQKLLEASWRRELTAGERALLEAGLVAQPDLRTAWQEETQLNALL